MREYQRELEIGLEAVKLAAQVCQQVQRKITPEKLDKKDQSPVTIADFASQALVCRALKAAFPDDQIVGEEDASELRRSENSAFLQSIQYELEQVGVSAAGDDICRWIDWGNGESGKRFWTLDPIDGTKGFLRGEQYAVSLALIDNGRIVLGVLGCPNLPAEIDTAESGSLLFARKSQGAFSVSLEAKDSERSGRSIQVSDARSWSEIRFCESVESGHSAQGRSAELAQRLGITKSPRRLDSQAKYAVVARGEADIYLRLPTKADYREKIWDHAGGVIIVEEAGGRVTDINGKSLDFTRGRELAVNQGVVVSNGRLHDELLAALGATK